MTQGAMLSEDPKPGAAQEVSVTDDELVRTTSEADDDEFARMTSGEVEFQANKHKLQRSKSMKSTKSTVSQSPADGVLDRAEEKTDGHHGKKKGAFGGVFVPTCENMWGVLIFLRFYVIVGQAGVGEALGVVALSFSAAFCTVSSMSAIVSSGGMVGEGGPYYMISRALGPCVGAAVGIMYWLAITMLAVLEVLGAVEGILMAAPSARFAGCVQAYGSVLMAGLAFSVYMGINFVHKMGIFFVFVVFFTLFSYYFGLIAAPATVEAQENWMVTGLSWETLQENWGTHYTDGFHFGTALSIFFPCFTGILSGANRADILKNPPRDIRHGTFGAIIFSFFMYSSFMILWGCVANYQYLQGKHHLPHPDGSDVHHRRLAGGGEGAYVVEEIVWNPFPHAAHVGIIISSLSQALQCLIVSPRLLQSIAKDDLIYALKPVSSLTKGEPARALGMSYVVAGLLVLIGSLDLVAPLLTMCFLVCYTFMNVSCFCLTWLKSPQWRPTGIQKKRWRAWYLGTGSCGFIICLVIMFTVSAAWAVAALLLAGAIYFYISWKLENAEWGSSFDGIRFQMALDSMIRLEKCQSTMVNWRPQVLILYKLRVCDELKGIHHHGILRFYNSLMGQKTNGFCVVACVLEGNRQDSHALHKAHHEKEIITTIMKQENIKGFSEVVVAPTWCEGANYMIQLTGIGGFVPNTVLIDWPKNWSRAERAFDFVQSVRTALIQRKSVMAIKGIDDMPTTSVVGTIDVWWMIQDGGFMILLCWMLVQHRVWRGCHLRVFSTTTNVGKDQAVSAGKALTEILRQRKLVDFEVEVVVADEDMLEPFNAEVITPSPSNDSKAADVQDVEMVVGGDAKDFAKDTSGEQDTNDCDLDVLCQSAVAAVDEMEQTETKTVDDEPDPSAVKRLNKVIHSHSKRSQLVVINMPEKMDSSNNGEAQSFLKYCDSLTEGLERVLFVKSSGHEVFDLQHQA